MPEVEYVKGHKVHVFECGTTMCHSRQRFVHCFLDTTDARLTGNLHQHDKACWGEEAVATANNMHDVKTAQEALRKAKSVDGTITELFESAAKERVTYKHHQHKLEAQ